MSTRIRVLLLVLAGVALVLGARLTLVPRREAGTRAVAASAARPARPQQPVTLEPDRPHPDARVAAAARALWTLSGHRDSLALAWRFADDAWHLQLRGEEAGTLGTYPTYEEIRRLLAGLSASMTPAAPLAGSAPNASAPIHVASVAGPAAPADLSAAPGMLEDLRALDALERADRAWRAGDHGARVLQLAERALLEMHLETNDQVGAADVLLGRALALSALRAGSEPGAGAEDECLLASRLGYKAEACAMAQPLPATSPVRAFVLQDDEALSRLAGPGASPFTAYLRLTRFADERDLPGWKAWRAQHLARKDLPRSPFLASELALGEFSDAPAAGAELSLTLCEELRLERDPDLRRAVARGKAPIGATMDAFETAIAAAPQGPDPALLDRDVVQAYCRSMFYSGLFGIGEFLRVRLSAVGETDAFAASMGEPAAPAAEEFARWYRHLSEVKSGKGSLAKLKRDLLTLPHFGEPLLTRSWWEIAKLAPLADLSTQVAARAMDRKLDTRPEALWTLSSVHAWPLYDLAWSEELMAASARGLHPADAARRARWAAFSGDSTTLVALLVDPRVNEREHAQVLASLASLEGDAAPVVEQAYREWLAHRPAEFDVVNAYAAHCFELGRFAEARAVLLHWLARRDRSQGAFDDIIARTEISRACERLGDLQAALAAAEPAAKSWKYSAMAREAHVLEAMGREDEALSIAVAALGRYPDGSDALAEVTRHLWRAGKYGKAAELLATSPYPPTGSAWRWELGPAFAHTFVGRPDEGVKAAEALAAKGIDVGRHLHELALAVRDSGNVALACQLYERIPAAGQEGFNAKIHACEMLRRSRGDAAARAYLGRLVGPVPGPQISYLEAFAYGNRFDDLLWMLPPFPGSGNDAEFSWLVRAASVVSRPHQDPARRAQVEQHFARPAQGRYATIGRFLLGHADEATITAEATNTRDLGEVYFYVGVREQAQGHYREAARAYARCIATGQRMNAEYGWSMSQLIEWAGRSMSLERVAAADRKSNDAGAGTPKSL
jgi:tetratricopeptide (TPR) repeat protein